jgi:tRNA threonylcarbamoyladenosine biosynthesis protein TsaE
MTMQKTKIYKIKNMQDLEDLCRELIKKFSARQLLLLNGEMASGKTTFVSTLVQSRGGSFANSPTYSIHQTYSTPNGPIDHIDLYRLKNDQDLESTGFL